MKIPPVGAGLMYTVSQELRSLFRNLIRELILSQKVIYTYTRVQFAKVQALWCGRLQLKCDGTRDAREGKWRGNWRKEWVASTLHTTTEHGVSSITTTDAHTSAASSRLNWRPRRFKWTRPFRRKTKSGFCLRVPSHFNWPVRIHSFCVQRSPDSLARNTEAGRNSSCISAWTPLDHVNNVFIFFHISLYLTYSMAVYTWKGTFFSQMLVNTTEHTSVGDSSSGYRSRYSSTAAVVLPVAKPVYKMHIGVFFIGKWRVYSYCSMRSYHNTKGLISLQIRSTTGLVRGATI